MPWCPYTDKDLSENEVSREHILPLALGGMNGFEIPACKSFNATAGSAIDGALANDFLIMFRRNQHDVRGHNNKRPVFKTNRAKDVSTGWPVHLTIGRTEGLKIWCPRSKRQIASPRIQFSTKIDVDLDLQFVAKVGLSAGYFAYGELFRQHVKHSELRIIMNNKLSDLGDDIYSIETRADNRFSSDKDQRLEVFRALCRAVPRHSIIGLVPNSASLSIFVGVLGYYMGMLNVPAVTATFPNTGAYQWGHVICPQDGKLARISFNRALRKLVRLA